MFQHVVVDEELRSDGVWNQFLYLFKKHGNGTEEKNHRHHTQNSSLSFGKNDIFLKVLPIYKYFRVSYRNNNFLFVLRKQHALNTRDDATNASKTQNI